MKKTTLLVTIAALALAGGCGKKKEDAKKKAPSTTTPTPTTPTATTPPTPPPPPPVVKLDGKDLGQRFIDCHAAWSAQDKDKFKACYAKDATSRWADSMAPEAKGPDAIAAGAFEFHAAFPDGKTQPQLVLVNGRDVASVLLFTGTNTAPMKMGPGMPETPATGKKVGMHILHMATFDDANQVTQEWWIMDDGTFGAQLGMPGAQGGRPVTEKGMDGAPNIVVATNSDVEKANLATSQKANDTFNAHDLKAIMADYADDAIESDQSAPADVVGKKGIESGLKMFLGGFPDAKVSSLKAWAAGDFVLSVSTFTATNTGNMGQMKKTGKPVTLTVAEIVKFDASKIKQAWRFFNSYAMAIQLGMAPDPTKPEGAAPGGAAPSPTPATK